MKSISELIRLIDSVGAVDLISARQSAERKFHEIAGAVNHANYHNEDALENIQRSYNIISAEQQSIEKTVGDYIEFLKQEIKKQEVNYQVSSEEIYYDSRHDTVEYRLARRKNYNFLAQSTELQEVFLGRLALYNRWQHPAIEIQPAFGQFTDLIKGCDPLYLLDTDEGMFESVKQRWNPAYQRRLRYYVFNETNQELFHMLPESQFGFVFCADYLDYKPMRIIENYLTDVYRRLKPGGTFMFTYNDCDKVYGARNVESKFRCYTPGTEIVRIAQQIGYTITKQFNEFENVSWLEVTKPGELTTLRGGQTLGEILSFSNAKTKEEIEAEKLKKEQELASRPKYPK